MKQKHGFELNSMTLHLLAMAIMLCDHLGWTVFRGHTWMNSVGRIAFPIFAFMLVEGYFHTRNLRKYVLRLAVFAVISEIPFNLMVCGRMWFPLHQNVLWTFLIGILVIYLLEKAKRIKITWLKILAFFGAIAAGYLLGLVSFVDYGYGGVFMVLAFYIFRQRNWVSFAGQFLMLTYINFVLLGKYGPFITLFGDTLKIPMQGLAILALLPIWLYRGRQGPHNKGLQYLYYGFYPAHLLILGLIQMSR